MSEGGAPSDGSRALGPLRALGWMAGALWWGAKSPAGVRALALAGLPWAALSLLNLPTAGLSMMAAVGFYPQLCLWSALWAREHFKGRRPPFNEVKDAWASRWADSRGLPLAFMAVAFAALAWATLCVQATSIGVLLEAMREAKDGEAGRALVAQAWDRSGLDGLLWPLAGLQAGLAAINGFWLCLPWAALGDPGQGAGSLLKGALARFKAAPGALCALGLAGSLVAQAGLVFPPFGLLAGVWFLACAFAARDLGAFPR